MSREDFRIILVEKALALQELLKTQIARIAEYIIVWLNLTIYDEQSKMEGQPLLGSKTQMDDF
jgi:hypothetical protein